MRLIHSVPWCFFAVSLAAVSCGSSSSKPGEHDGGPAADAANDASGGGPGDGSGGAPGDGSGGAPKDVSNDGSKDASGRDAMADAGGCGHMGDAAVSDAKSDAKSDGGPPGNDHCANATVLSLASPTQELDIVTTTLGATHDVDAPCASDPGADVFFKFSISKPVFAYADTFGTCWNTLLYFLASDCTPISKTTTAGDAACNDDACGTQESQAVALLAPGTYFLGLSGTGGGEGAATIHFQWAAAGSGTVTQLPQGSTVQMGTTTGATGNLDGMTGQCIAAGPENTYWWMNCPDDPGGPLTASTCGGATWETVLETEIPVGDPYQCNLDSCGLQTALNTTVPAGAGERVLYVDGQGGNDKGAYTLTVTRP